MMAAATGTTRTAFQFFRGRNVPKLERLAHKLVDPLLHVVHCFLGIDKSPGHRIAQKRLALRIKGRNLRRRKLQSLLLLMMQFSAFFAQALVLLLGFGIRHKRIHRLADALKFGLLNNGFAQFPRFLEDRILGLNICFHNISCYAIRPMAVRLQWQHSIRHASNKFDTRRNNDLGLAVRFGNLLDNATPSRNFPEVS